MMCALQKKAWYDQQACTEWALRCFAKDVEKVPGKNLLFMDNLDGQTCPPFRAALARCNTKPHFYAAQATDEIQVVDGGIGKDLKHIAQQILEKRLIEDTVFYEKW